MYTQISRVCELEDKFYFELVTYSDPRYKKILHSTRSSAIFNTIQDAFDKSYIIMNECNKTNSLPNCSYNNII